MPVQSFQLTIYKRKKRWQWKIRKNCNDRKERKIAIKEKKRKGKERKENDNRRKVKKKTIKEKDMTDSSSTEKSSIQRKRK